jgi:Flp pilus assembly protein CpaB
MKFRYVFLIAVLTFGAGFVAGAMAVGVPLFFQLVEARVAQQQAKIADLTADRELDTQVFVLVAKRRIQQWSTIREPAEMFEVELASKATLPANAVTVAQPDMIETVKGRRVRATLEPGHRLTEDDLLKKEVTGIDAMLEKGKRAMAIPIVPSKEVGFFVVPGSKVDVVQTLDGKSQLILKDVLVLAIDLETSAAEDRPPRGGTATLQLDNNEQVLKLATRPDKGTLSLVLRSVEDDEKEGPAKAPPPPPPPFDEKK